MIRGITVKNKSMLKIIIVEIKTEKSHRFHKTGIKYENLLIKFIWRNIGIFEGVSELNKTGLFSVSIFLILRNFGHCAENSVESASKIGNKSQLK